MHLWLCMAFATYQYLHTCVFKHSPIMIAHQRVIQCLVKVFLCLSIWLTPLRPYEWSLSFVNIYFWSFGSNHQHPLLLWDHLHCHHVDQKLGTILTSCSFLQVPRYCTIVLLMLWMKRMHFHCLIPLQFLGILKKTIVYIRHSFLHSMWPCLPFVRISIRGGGSLLVDRIPKGLVIVEKGVC